MKLALATLLFASIANAQSIPALDSFARDLLARTGTTPGLSIAVVQGDRVVHVGAYGMRDASTNAPVTPDTRFYTASGVKAFTAASVLLLAHEGKLNLDAPLTKAMPRLKLTPPLDAERVSLRDALAHRPGFFNGAVNYRTNTAGNIDRDGIFDSLARYSTVRPIEFFYSNMSYVVAMLAAEEVTGKPWHEVLRTMIFTPLGMTATTTHRPDANVPVAVPHIDEDHNRFRTGTHKPDAAMNAAGSTFTTAGDLAKWLLAHVNERRVFPARMIRQMHAPQAQVSIPWRDTHRYAFALGWYHADYEGDVMLQAFGGRQGAYCHVSLMPEHRIGVAVLSNGGGASADLLASYAYDTLLGKKGLGPKYDPRIAKIREAAVKNREALRAVDAQRVVRPLPRPGTYAGRYDSDRLGSMIVTEESGRLFATVGVSRGELYVSGDAFLVEWDGDGELEPFRFVQNETGGTKAVDLDGRIFERVP